MLAGRLSGGASFVLPAGEAEVKLAHLSSAVVGNVSLHPDNRTLLYRAELAGGRALDRFIEEPDAVAAEAERGDAAMLGISGCLSPTRRPLPSSSGSPASKQQQQQQWGGGSQLGLKSSPAGGQPLRASLPGKSTGAAALLTAGGGSRVGGEGPDDRQRAATERPSDRIGGGGGPPGTSLTLTLAGLPGSAAGRARRGGGNVLSMSLDAVSTMRPKVWWVGWH